MKRLAYLCSTVLVSFAVISTVLTGCSFGAAKADPAKVEQELENDFLAVEDSDSKATQEFVNALLETSFSDNGMLLEDLIVESTDKMRQASETAASAYGSDSYDGEYHKYASWNALNGLYKTLLNEVDHAKKEKKQFSTGGYSYKYDKGVYRLTFECTGLEEQTFVTMDIVEGYDEISVRDGGLVSSTREEEKNKDDTNLSIKHKMKWFGSGVCYTVSDSGDRAYFYYADDVLSPKALSILTKAGKSGLDTALGWSDEDTSKMLDEIFSGAVSDEQKDRINGYFSLGGDSYRGFDYFNLDKKAYPDGYYSLGIDLKLINEASERILGKENSLENGLH